MPNHVTETPRAPLEVLLVEDDPGDVLIAQEALRAGNLTSRLNVVSDGDAALAYLRRENGYGHVERPDLILLDLNLPGKRGHQVLAEVKNDPALRDPGGGADHVRSRGGRRAQLRVARQRLRHQAGRLRSFRRGREADRRLLP